MKMTANTLEILQRNETLRECRDGDFIPAVLYGQGFEKGEKIKVDRSAFERVIRQQGESSTLWIKVGDETKYALIKEVQKDLVKSEILHVDFQAISQDEEIQVKIPVIFEGRETLEAGSFILQIILSEIDITGKAIDVPESISVDVSKLSQGDKVTVGDLAIPEGMEVAQEPEETLAIVIVPSVSEEAETEEAETESTEE